MYNSLRRLRLPIALIIFCALFSSCEKECACPDPETCTKCDGSCCSCCIGGHKYSVVVQGIMPDDYTPESFALAYNSVGNSSKVTLRQFYGDNTTITSNQSALDFLMYNNDGETVLLSDDNVASTNIAFGTDTLNYQPNPFYTVYQSSTSIADVDTVKLQLVQRVFDYTVTVELTNNDGRVANVTAVVIGGMAGSLNLKTEELSGSAAYSVAMSTVDVGLYGTFTSFGPGQGRQYLTMYFRRENYETDSYVIDITDQVQPLTKGGDIWVSIDVMSVISATPSMGNDGFNVEYTDWSNNQDVEIQI